MDRAVFCFSFLLIVDTVAFADDFVSMLNSASKGCQAGVHQDCLAQGQLLVKRRIGADVEQATKLFKSACDKDIVEGCLQLGSLADFGIGQPKNNNLALTFYEKACDLESEVGCLKGIIASNDVEKRLKLLEKACQLKNAVACKRLEGKLKPDRCASAMNHVWSLGSSDDHDGTTLEETIRRCEAFGIDNWIADCLTKSKTRTDLRRCK